MTAMGLFRPDLARGKPSSLLKSNEDYLKVFNSSIELDIYYWVAKTQRSVDTFIVSEDAQATIQQKSNLKYHLSMLVAEHLNGGPVRQPRQLKRLAAEDVEPSPTGMLELFRRLKTWSEAYLAANNAILERAAKTQRFTDYLLDCAAQDRAKTANEAGDAT